MSTGSSDTGRTSSSSTTTDNIPPVADPEQGKVQRPQPGVQRQDGPPFSDDTDESVETSITSIRATDVALGLRRVPAGFYATVHQSGHAWKTENKGSSVNHDVIEWTGPIQIPSDLSAIVHLKVYASFEFESMLGTGEQLRELTVTVEQLLDHSVRDAPFMFFPKDGNVVSPCSSISMTIERRECRRCDLSPSGVLHAHHSITESLGELEDVTNSGHSTLLRYRKQGEKLDLVHSVRDFARALSLCPVDHPCRAVAESNLAMAKFILCQVENTDASLEVPLGLYRSALRTRPTGHTDRPRTLIQMAAVHFAQFERSKDEVQGAQAKELLREATEISSAGSHESQAARFMLQLYDTRWMCALGDGQPSVEQVSTLGLTDDELWISSLRLLQRFGRFGTLDDLQQAIVILKRLVRSTPVRDDRYARRLCILGVALLDRYKRLGQLLDLQDAVSTQRDAVDLTPDGHPNKPACLSNLGGSFKTRFERLGELHDLEDAISTLRQGVDLTPSGHASRHSRLNNLGNSLYARFERFWELHDLEEAISALRNAVHLTPQSHPRKPSHLNNLGNALVTRFQHIGELHNLDDAISVQRNAIDLTPDDHPDRPAFLNSLGNSLITRFERLEEVHDLVDAISAQRNAVALTPDDHPNKPTYLSNLGNAFVARFQRLGEIRDIEDAISMQRRAIALTPDGHLDKLSRLSSIGNTFFTRFKRLGDVRNLEDAISMQRSAADLTPDGHSHKPARLSTLGNSLRTRFESLGEIRDLEGAISTQRKAVELTPDDHPDKSTFLNSLGNSFVTRFQRLGEVRDLEDAISMQMISINLTPDGHPHKPARLTNLGTAFRTRFERLGEVRDLENAISMQRSAVGLTFDGHPHKPGCLGNLGDSFITRFQHLGEVRDLEDAISTQRNAVDLTPDGQPDKPDRLNNLGNSFIIRFERLGEIRDLEDAISTQCDAVGLTPDAHPDKSACLSNLGNAFVARFERLGEIRDLDDAISMQKNAIYLTPDGHPYKPRYLNNLGNSLITRFWHLGEVCDLKDAISMQWMVIDLTPDGHPLWPARLNNLGDSLRIRFERFGELNDLNDALAIYAHAASAPFGPIAMRFRASRNWITCARRIHHHTLLRAYSVAINLVPQLAWIGLSLSHRFSELTRGANVVHEAAAAALDAGFPETAVEWLERGRSIVWGELFQLRSSYDELSSTHPDHARRLRELSAALDHASATREKSLSTQSELSSSAAESALEVLQQEADRHRALAIERDELLQEIRRLPGFETFLRHKLFSQLRASAHTGPVVILNAAESRCDALIVLPNVNHVIHVPLPNFTLKRSVNLQNTLKSFIRHAREGQSAKRDSGSWETFLSPLWKCVVNPVLNALAFSVPGDLSHIFWCPAGPFAFLPIHAAGLYDDQYSQPGHKVSDFVVSSYAPTLAFLAPSANPAVVHDDNTHFLVVRQPQSDGQPSLPGVVTEVEHIRKIIKNSPSARTALMETSVGTVEEVMALMKDAECVHFACHGIQDGVNSGLCLADGRRLKVRDIIGLSRPRGGLAFLSACQTAMGDKRLSDEAIHIAAGMLFAGYEGVIGTMWSIRDKIAPDVARDVYAHLFRNGTRPDYREAARALHEAIENLRGGGGVSFDEWVPFIHVGL